MTNNSPWIHQLDKERKMVSLSQDEKCDVAIIGAGIAGISTAFFLLKHTKKKVVLVEGYKLAHGATGHNAGQLVSYFEKSFKDLVAEFGLDMACEGQRSVNSAWELLDEMYTEAGLDIPLFRFEGYSGYANKDQVISHLENSFLRRSGGLYESSTEIAEDTPFLHEIPEKYHGFLSLVSREEIMIKLETFDTQYVALSSMQKGVMNSALFCQEMINYLLGTYPKRFSFYEHTPVRKVVLHDNGVILDALKHTVECQQVVLCTNGFDNFEILAPSGLAVNTRFHHSIQGVVAFMAGYLEKFTGIPAALCYFRKDALPGDPYPYVTRRPYEYETQTKHNLVCIGGPEFELESREKYNRELEFSDEARDEIRKFVRTTYDKNTELEFSFMWHGVMGYTNNLVRMIGPDPTHSRLLYNLGCNGVGLLPSIFGGNKVARIIAGEKFPQSLFDVPLVLDSQKEHSPALALS